VTQRRGRYCARLSAGIISRNGTEARYYGGLSK
jgi:hypothetical protein